MKIVLALAQPASDDNAMHFSQGDRHAGNILLSRSEQELMGPRMKDFLAQTGSDTSADCTRNDRRSEKLLQSSTQHPLNTSSSSTRSSLNHDPSSDCRAHSKRNSSLQRMRQSRQIRNSITSFRSTFNPYRSDNPAARRVVTSLRQAKRIVPRTEKNDESLNRDVERRCKLDPLDVNLSRDLDPEAEFDLLRNKHEALCGLVAIGSRCVRHFVAIVLACVIPLYCVIMFALIKLSLDLGNALFECYNLFLTLFFLIDIIIEGIKLNDAV
jgi:hypothetical protein